VNTQMSSWTIKLALSDSASETACRETKVNQFIAWGTSRSLWAGVCTSLTAVRVTSVSRPVETARNPIKDTPLEHHQASLHGLKADPDCR
jgi:hypothetical protein